VSHFCSSIPLSFFLLFPVLFSSVSCPPYLVIHTFENVSFFGKIYALGGFNFIRFWNFKRNQTENDRYWQNFIFAKCLKMYIFFAFAFKICKMCYYDPNNFFVKNINLGIKKCRILCWFQIRWCQLSKVLLKKLKAKTTKKWAKTKILKIRIVFWL
jgi:hypothetical protein